MFSSKCFLDIYFKNCDLYVMKSRHFRSLSSKNYKTVSDISYKVHLGFTTGL